MRQILLPVDPPALGERNRNGGDGGDSRSYPASGCGRCREVLADVLIWRLAHGCRAGQAGFRGVPGFRGIQVPAADLHALALGQLDEAALDQRLRACLALDWRSAPGDWPSASVYPGAYAGPAASVRQGLAPGAAGAQQRTCGGTAGPVSSGGSPSRAAKARLALRPDWAARLAAGQVRAVHDEAAARLRGRLGRSARSRQKADGGAAA